MKRGTGIDGKHINEVFLSLLLSSLKQLVLEVQTGFSRRLVVSVKFNALHAVGPKITMLSSRKETLPRRTIYQRVEKRLYG